MEANEIATKNDVNNAVNTIMEFIRQSLEDAGIRPAPAYATKYLRSRDIKEMFGVSDNKLKDMRLTGEIPYIKNGKTFFYPEDEIRQYMNKRLSGGSTLK